MYYLKKIKKDYTIQNTHPQNTINKTGSRHVRNTPLIINGISYTMVYDIRYYYCPLRGQSEMTSHTSSWVEKELFPRR